jgi:hypothetical protein
MTEIVKDVGGRGWSLLKVNIPVFAWRICNEKFHNFYSHSFVRMVKSRRLKCVIHVGCKGET